MHWQILNLVVLAGWLYTCRIGGRGVLWDILETWSRVEKGSRTEDFLWFSDDGVKSSLLERR